MSDVPAHSELLENSGASSGDEDGPASRLQLSRGAIAAVSGATAGFISGIVVCPLDVVKTRLQVQGSFPETEQRYSGIASSLRRIVSEEGIRGLYRGLGPLVVGYLPTWGIYFYIYGKVRRRMERRVGLGSHTAALVAAVTAGATSTVATNPIWMIKTRLMAQSPRTSWQYSGIVDAARSIARNEGFLMFYSGLAPALLGLPHVAIHFPLYEALKQKFGADTSTGWRSTAGFLAASVLSKIIASTATYPHEVIRSRNQIITGKGRRKYHGILPTVKILYREEGWRVFYAGLATNIARAVPASAVTLVTFELISGQLSERFLFESYE